MSRGATASHPALVDARPEVFWLDDPARPGARPALTGAAEADLVVVGGGYAGLWAALRAKEREPGRDVVLLEKDRCGDQASGRTPINGPCSRKAKTAQKTTPATTAMVVPRAVPAG